MSLTYTPGLAASSFLDTLIALEQQETVSRAACLAGHWHITEQRIDLTRKCLYLPLQFVADMCAGLYACMHAVNVHIIR